MRRCVRPSVEPCEPRSLLSALACSLTTNMSAYQLGQPIEMTFTETNTSNQPVRLAVGPVNSGFDVVQDGVRVWASNAGIQPQYLLLKTLQPGQSETLQATWDGVPNFSQGGELTGTFTVTNQQAPTGASATFTILPAAPTGSVSATLSADKSAIRPGKTVALSMTLTNTGDAPVTIPNGVDSDFFSASRLGQAPVWYRTGSGGPTTSVVLAPGQSVTFTTSWNGRPNQGHARALHRGTYTLFAEDAGYEARATIRIV